MKKIILGWFLVTTLVLGGAYGLLVENIIPQSKFPMFKSIIPEGKLYKEKKEVQKSNSVTSKVELKENKSVEFEKEDILVSEKLEIEIAKPVGLKQVAKVELFSSKDKRNQRFFISSNNEKFGELELISKGATLYAKGFWEFEKFFFDGTLDKDIFYMINNSGTKSDEAEEIMKSLKIEKLEDFKKESFLLTLLNKEKTGLNENICELSNKDKKSCFKMIASVNKMIEIVEKEGTYDISIEKAGTLKLVYKEGLLVNSLADLNIRQGETSAKIYLKDGKGTISGKVNGKNYAFIANDEKYNLIVKEGLFNELVNITFNKKYNILEGRLKDSKEDQIISLYITKEKGHLSLNTAKGGMVGELDYKNEGKILTMDLTGFVVNWKVTVDYTNLTLPEISGLITLAGWGEVPFFEIKTEKTTLGAMYTVNQDKTLEVERFDNKSTRFIAKDKGEEVLDIIIKRLGAATWYEPADFKKSPLK